MMMDQKDQIEVVYTRLPAGLGGLYDHPTRTIFIDDRLNCGARRATEEHERVHAERGDSRCEDPWFNTKQENLVENETARRLIPVEELAEALVWCRDDHELAEYLEVDRKLILARRKILTEIEIAYINERIDALEEGL